MLSYSASVQKATEWQKVQTVHDGIIFDCCYDERFLIFHSMI